MSVRLQASSDWLCECVDITLLNLTSVICRVRLGSHFPSRVYCLDSVKQTYTALASGRCVEALPDTWYFEFTPVTLGIYFSVYNHLS